MAKSGIRKEEFFEALAGSDAKERGAVRFFLQFCWSVFVRLRACRLLLLSCTCFIEETSWEAVNNAARLCCYREWRVASEAELFETNEQTEASLKDFSKTILDFLAVSEECRKNPFGQWGLPEWSDICPRGTQERAYLVVHAEKKPLHFREIAAKIDLSGLQNRASDASANRAQ